MRSVQIEFYRICFCLVVLSGITLWQLDFVLTSVNANPALNMIIFGTCVFGFMLVFSAISALRNKFRAFYALTELYDDVKNEETIDNADPLWRYHRCSNVGIIFRKPRILGQSYQLISGQLLRDRDLQISASTMQTLIDGIDERLGEGKSLMSYVAGILIFLGLIGTFLGLMITLASVGDILGGLDLSGSDPTETVASLMTNLQTPLKGMATGFSSSLFGLVTSLTVSLMIQLVSRAGVALKIEFSDWLSNVVKLHDSSVGESTEITIDGLPISSWAKNGGSGGESLSPEEAIRVMNTNQLEERRLALLMRAARHAVVSTNRHSREFGKMTKAVHALTNEARASKEFLADVGDGLRVVTEQNRLIHLTLARTIDAFDRVSKTADTKAEIAELTGLLSSQLEIRDARLGKVLRQTYKKVSDLAAPSANEDKFSTEGDELAEELRSRTTELNLRQLRKLLALANKIDDATARMAEKSTKKRVATGQ